MESRFDSGTTPSFLVFDPSAPSSGTLSPSLIIPMATTTIWNIRQLERHTADGIVFTAHYTVDANDGTYSAGAYGSVGLEAPEGNVIPYADLTPEVVIGWVQEKLGGEEKVTEIKAALQLQIDEQRTPTTAAGVPWA